MALYGVDVSHWNGKIDFEKFATDKNSEFMIVKATQGAEFIDCQCSYNLDACREYDIFHGMYHYLVGNVDALSQAKHFINVYREYGDKCTVLALDVEDITLTDMNYRYVVEMVETFCAEVYDQTDVFPLIYVSRCFMNPTMFTEIGKKCAGWIAAWGSQNPKRLDLNTTICQYSSNGSVNGIKGDVDLDIAYVTRKNWLKLAGI